MFEARETAHGGRRIVRVGSHTGAGNLPARVSEHFTAENKDRSVFRRHIGRALLSRDGDPFLAQWELDLTTRAARARYAGQVDAAKQRAVEAVVTRTIQRYFGFVVLPVADKAERLCWEAGHLATVAQCAVCAPSSHWLGNDSPDARVRESGLWNVRHLQGPPLSRPK
jgi:hypothetical protein